MLDGKQIKDASIAAAKLAASVLAGLLKADGTVAWTGNQNAAGSYTIQNLRAPTLPTDAARLADIHAQPWKDKVRVASDVNITLSGEQTVATVAVSNGDRVLVRAQTNAAENGIYVVGTPWVRAADADTADELRGAVVYVEATDKRYAQSEDTITLGTTAVTWVDIGTGNAAAVPSSDHKDMAASATAADYSEACATPIIWTPAGDGYVRVFVNGVAVSVGNGVRSTDCYFSGDGGATARSIANIQAGDTLYWVGSVAGYQLAVTDRVDFDFSV